MAKTIFLALSGAVALLADLHVPSSVALAAAENKPPPEYSRIARQLRVAGDVAVEVHIGQTGAVETVTVLSGNAMLAAPVLKTVKIWKFKPFTQGGQPVKASTVLRFTFK
jgi:TonB family protein